MRQGGTNSQINWVYRHSGHSRQHARFTESLSSFCSSRGLALIETPLTQRGAADYLKIQRSIAETSRDLLTFQYHTALFVPGNINVKYGYLPGTLAVDFRGYSQFHSMARSETRIPIEWLKDVEVDTAEAFVRTYLQKKKSKYDQPLAVDEFPKRFVLFALQNPDDYSLRGIGLEGMLVWLEQVLQFAREQKIQLALKEHPDCLNWGRDGGPCGAHNVEYRKKIEGLLDANRDIYRVRGNVFDAIAQSVAVACVNSGVGFEAILMRKPVLTGGPVDYRAATFTNLGSLTLQDLLRFDSHYSFNFALFYLQWHNFLAPGGGVFSLTLEFILMRAYAAWGEKIPGDMIRELPLRSDYKPLRGIRKLLE